MDPRVLLFFCHHEMKGQSADSPLLKPLPPFLYPCGYPSRCPTHVGVACVQAQSRRKLEHENGRSGAPRVGLGRALTADDVSAPRELREALLQVSQGVEHLHSLRIVHR